MAACSRMMAPICLQQAGPEGWTARDKLTAVMETASLNESACPARSRRVPSTAESEGSIRGRSPPGEGPVSLRRIGPVRVAGSRPPWIVMHVSVSNK